ncbi:hypothetical protein D2E26_0503 [Bifidobacterium dolichotidis]|uniref:TIGR00341 family protein n=1 Tax=Bifidobacterium dolichotidis TaxID=2306976 RepID=A0A430FSU8_9BIFI|nr:DUF389 domain-containing protein [Bifidobacterium dolichotidis]RSX55940.1 hypothetical protein D2E26_0503 [Bifidobacterium dolichotidis]
MATPMEWLLVGSHVSLDQLDAAKESTYVDVSSHTKSYSAYAWRLALSAVIATGGIASQSPAVVIGAMLIAPLMSPMVGTQLAIVLGNKRAVWRTILMTWLGVIGAIAISLVIAAMLPVKIDTTTNTEVLARVSPRLVDLIVALASGLMGALAEIREDIPDTITGVAIAASLVPPLCVVGISLYAQDWRSAAGSMLLFLANYCAIEFMGMLVFIALHLDKHFPQQKGLGTRKWRYIFVIACVAVVAMPLTFTSLNIAQSSIKSGQVKEVATQWVQNTNWSVQEVKVQDDVATVYIDGADTTLDDSKFLAMLNDAHISLKGAKVVIIPEFSIGPSGQYANPSPATTQQ